MADLIDVIPDAIIRSVYIRECTKILDIDEADQERVMALATGIEIAELPPELS